MLPNENNINGCKQSVNMKMIARKPVAQSRPALIPSIKLFIVTICISANLIKYQNSINYKHNAGLYQLAEAGSKSSSKAQKTTVIAISGGGGGAKAQPVPVPWPVVHCHHHHHHLKYVPKPVLVHHWVKKYKHDEFEAATNEQMVELPPGEHHQHQYKANNRNHGSAYHLSGSTNNDQLMVPQQSQLLDSDPNLVVGGHSPQQHEMISMALSSPLLSGTSNHNHNFNGKLPFADLMDGSQLVSALSNVFDQNVPILPTEEQQSTAAINALLAPKIGRPIIQFPPTDLSTVVNQGKRTNVGPRSNSLNHRRPLDGHKQHYNYTTNKLGGKSLALSSKQIDKLHQTIMSMQNGKASNPALPSLSSKKAQFNDSQTTGKRKSTPTQLADTEFEDSFKNVALASLNGSMANDDVKFSKSFHGGGLSFSIGGDLKSGLASNDQQQQLLQQQTKYDTIGQEELDNQLVRATTIGSKPNHPFDGPSDQLKDESANRVVESLTSQQQPQQLILDLDRANSMEESQANRAMERLNMEQLQRVRDLNQANGQQAMFSSFNRQQYGSQHPTLVDNNLVSNQQFLIQQPAQAQLMVQHPLGEANKHLSASLLMNPSISARNAATSLSEMQTINLMTRLAEKMAQNEAKHLIELQARRNTTTNGKSGAKQLTSTSSSGKGHFLSPLNLFSRFGISPFKNSRERRRFSTNAASITDKGSKISAISSFDAVATSSTKAKFSNGSRTWPSKNIPNQRQQVVSMVYPIENQASNYDLASFSSGSQITASPLFLHIRKPSESQQQMNQAASSRLLPTNGVEDNQINLIDYQTNQAKVQALANEDTLASESSNTSNKIMDPVSATLGQSKGQVAGHSSVAKVSLQSGSTAPFGNKNSSNSNQVASSSQALANNRRPVLFKLNLANSLAQGASNSQVASSGASGIRDSNRQQSAPSSTKPPFKSGSVTTLGLANGEASSRAQLTQLSILNPALADTIQATGEQQSQMASVISQMSPEQESKFYLGQREHLSKVQQQQKQQQQQLIPTTTPRVPGGDSKSTTSQPNIVTGSTYSYQPSNVQESVAQAPQEMSLGDQQVAPADQQQVAEMIAIDDQQQQRQNSNWPIDGQDFGVSGSQRQQTTGQLVPFYYDQLLATKSSRSNVMPSQQAYELMYQPSQLEQQQQQQQQQMGSSYLEFPMSPHQWSSEALKSMNGHLDQQQQQVSESSQAEQSEQQMDGTQEQSGDPVASADNEDDPMSARAKLLQEEEQRQQQQQQQQQQQLMAMMMMVGGNEIHGPEAANQYHLANQMAAQATSGSHPAATATHFGGHQYAAAIPQGFYLAGNPSESHNPLGFANGNLASQQDVFFQQDPGQQLMVANGVGAPPTTATSYATSTIPTVSGSGFAFAPPPVQHLQTSSQQAYQSQASSFVEPAASALVAPKGAAKQQLGPVGAKLAAKLAAKPGSKSASYMDLGGPSVQAASNEMNRWRQFQAALGAPAANMTGGVGQALRVQAQNLQARLPQMPQMPNIPQPPQLPNLPMPPPGMMQTMAGVALPFALARATRNSERFRNQQVNAAANAGGANARPMSAGQRFIQGATSLTNRLVNGSTGSRNRRRRRPAAYAPQAARPSRPSSSLWVLPTAGGGKRGPRRPAPALLILRKMVDMSRVRPAAGQPALGSAPSALALGSAAISVAASKSPVVAAVVAPAASGPERSAGSKLAAAAASAVISSATAAAASAASGGLQHPPAAGSQHPLASAASKLIKPKMDVAPNTLRRESRTSAGDNPESNAAQFKSLRFGKTPAHATGPISVLMGAKSAHLVPDYLSRQAKNLAQISEGHEQQPQAAETTIVLPGTLEATANDGSLVRFNSMTAPVDILARQLLERKARELSLHRASIALNNANKYQQQNVQTTQANGNHLNQEPGDSYLDFYEEFAPQLHLKPSTGNDLLRISAANRLHQQSPLIVSTNLIQNKPTLATNEHSLTGHHSSSNDEQANGHHSVRLTASTASGNYFHALGDHQRPSRLQDGNEYHMASPITGQQQPSASLPVPLVANHINLLLFTAQNVTGNMLRPRPSAPVRGDEQIPPSSPHSSNQAPEPSQQQLEPDSEGDQNSDAQLQNQAAGGQQLQAQKLTTDSGIRQESVESDGPNQADGQGSRMNEQSGQDEQQQQQRETPKEPKELQQKEQSDDNDGQLAANKANENSLDEQNQRPVDESESIGHAFPFNMMPLAKGSGTSYSSSVPISLGSPEIITTQAPDLQIIRRPIIGHLSPIIPTAPATTTTTTTTTTSSGTMSTSTTRTPVGRATALAKLSGNSLLASKERAEDNNDNNIGSRDTVLAVSRPKLYQNNRQPIQATQQHLKIKRSTSPRPSGNQSNITSTHDWQADESHPEAATINLNRQQTQHQQEPTGGQSTESPSLQVVTFKHDYGSQAFGHHVGQQIATTTTTPKAASMGRVAPVSESASRPPAANATSESLASDDYVRAIKLVRGVAYPWPPPTKSSKAFQLPSVSTFDTLIGVN